MYDPYAHVCEKKRQIYYFINYKEKDNKMARGFTYELFHFRYFTRHSEKAHIQEIQAKYK